MANTNKTLLSLAEAAEELGRSPLTLRRDFYAGRIAAVRFSPTGKLYFKRQDLDAYLGRARHAAVGEN